MSPHRESAGILDAARELYSPAAVDALIADLASRISASVADRNPVVLAVMRGGAFTAVNLCRHFDFPYQFDYVDVSRYGSALTGGEVQWRVRPQLRLEGRVVLVVDDVLDRGVTLAELARELERIGAAERHVAVLVSKDVRDAPQRLVPDFVGVHTPDVWLVGCGMDYKGYWRGLPGLYALEEA